MSNEHAHIDYLRLASWKAGQYTSTLARLMRAWEHGWEPGRWLQYKGWKKEQLFAGHGDQDGKAHSVISVSGSLSTKLFGGLKTLFEWYCTRLDVQVTIPKPDNLTLADVRNRCDTKNTTLIESADNDTLYLGARTSEIFTRLYEKPTEVMYLRLEFELKGGRARQAWLAIRSGESVTAIFVYYLRRSKLPDDIKELFESYDTDTIKESMRDVELHGKEKTLKWLRNLDGCMEKNMSCHQIGEQVKTLVRSWAAYADDIDNRAANEV